MQTKHNESLFSLISPRLEEITYAIFMYFCSLK